MTTTKAAPKAAGTTERTAYLVLGMHRSGTSAVTQVLALAGASLPENVMAGDEHNAKGYFEPWKIAILNDGMLYVIYGYHLSKLDPKTGAVVATVTLPTGDAAPGDTTYNGFSASADGVIVGKSFYRQAGCTIQGQSFTRTRPASPWR